MHAHLPLFPTSGRVPEARQIGRGETIDRLHARVDRGQHALLFGDRRIGKSSVAAAVIARVRDVGNVGIDLDFSGAVTNPSALVASLLRQATDLGAGGESSAARIRDALRVRAERARDLLKLGAAMGFDEAAGIDRYLDGLAPAGGSDDLRRVLTAILGEALVTDRRVVILLDEVQHLAGWPDTTATQQVLAAAMRDPNGPSVIFAGSEQRPVEELFAVGCPLHEEGLWFEVPRISDEAWTAGLLERFREGGVTVDASMIRQILAIRDGHPQDTMRICEHAFEWAVRSQGRKVDANVLRQAHQEARRHPSWGTR